MSHIIYGQNKILCFIQLSEELKHSENKFLEINPLVLTVYHFHYPCIYYEKIFTHFKNHLLKKDKDMTFHQIRLFYQDQELPSDFPIGLFMQKEGRLYVKISNVKISEPYNIIKQNWKQAFTGINPLRGNYYIARQLSQVQLRKRYEQYVNGQSHNFQKQQFQGYEGTNIVTRFFIEGQIVERRSETGQNKTVLDLIKEEMPLLEGKKYTVKSHGILFDLGMNLKQFLDQWSYNDGFCYLKIQVVE